MSHPGYWPSPWPAEDGGPARLQAAAAGSTFDLRRDERLAGVHRRTWLSTMTVLGDPGQVFLLTHQALRARLGLPTRARVERIDPHTLRPLQRSPWLAGGPMWPGSLAVLASGELLAVYGCHAHRLGRDCSLRQTLRLPRAQAYNGFVVLDNGLVVTKNLSREHEAHLSVLQPRPLAPACAEVPCGEPSVARLSAMGNTVYVVGTRHIRRWHWDEGAQTLRADPQWRYDYIGSSDHSHGWDVVLDGDNAWFMDNGWHCYSYTMVGAGVSRSANRLIRVSLHDARDHESWPVSGLPGGSVTNPPLFDVQRRIIVGYDSANRVLRAWQLQDGQWQPLWQHTGFGCASHMVLYPHSGELLVNDWQRLREQVVLLDIASGQERGRVRAAGRMQGVVFPSVGWNRDVYWSSMDGLSRIHVAPA